MSVSAFAKAFTTILVEVPTNVMVPPKIAANETGINNLDMGTLFRLLHLYT